jgi:4-aminobutyrate aminotransferase-like enzyme
VGAVVAALRERQVLTRGIVTGALQISPPLVIEERQVNQLVEAVTDALESLEGVA